MTLARYVFALLVLAFVIWMLVAVRSSNGDPFPTPTTTTGPDPTPTPTSTPVLLMPPLDDVLLLKLQTKLRREHRRYVVAHRRVRELTRTLQHSTSTREAIDLACQVYGSCSTLWRRALCESHGYRFAQNASGASGLFQFLPSTWESTPFADFSMWSPYAQALAAGWMQTHGRGGEWSCR